MRPLLPSFVRRFSSDKISDMSPKSVLIFLFIQRSNLLIDYKKNREKHVLYTTLTNIKGQCKVMEYVIYIKHSFYLINPSAHLTKKTNV